MTTTAAGSTGPGMSFWQMAGWWRLRRFILPQRKTISLGVLLLLGEAGATLLKPWPLKFVFDDILNGKSLEGTAVVLLVGSSSLVVVVAALDGLLSYLAAVHLNRAGRIIVFDLRSSLFDHIQRLSLQFHNRRSTGDILTRVTADVKALRDVLTESLAEILKSVLFLIAMGAVLLWLDWKLTLVVIGAAPLLFLVLLRYTNRVQTHSRAERKREGALASVLHEALETIRLTRAFNQEEKTKKRFQTESLAGLESGLAAELTGERFSWAIDVLGAIVIAAVLGYGTQRVMTGELTPGTLLVFVSYARDFYKPLRAVTKHVNKFNMAAPRVERIVELLDVKEAVSDLPGASPAPQFRGQIEFCDVTFDYQFSEPVLRGIDLTIPEKQVTAIVGPTGAGKTTLISLIPRLYDPTKGTILVDGRDIRKYTLHSLRSQISVVFQESVLLRASIGENIAYGCPFATREDVVTAASAANAHDFIMALPEGYDTEVGERGETLSGGQRQLIAVARTIIRDASIVILDEPLAGLDAASAAAMLEALRRLGSGRTVIAITHNLSLLQLADHVVVLNDGRVVQQGHHHELAGTAGIYRRFLETGFQSLVALRSSRA